MTKKRNLLRVLDDQTLMHALERAAHALDAGRCCLAVANEQVSLFHFFLAWSAATPNTPPVMIELIVEEEGCCVRMHYRRGVFFDLRGPHGDEHDLKAALATAWPTSGN